jgi:hypothetical protein
VLAATWALSALALVSIGLVLAVGPLAGRELAPRGALLAAVLAALPLAAVRLARRAARGTARVERGLLVVEAGGRSLATPVSILGSARARRLPLPSDGVALRLASGRPFPLALDTDEPAALLDLLSATGTAGVSRPPARLAWARARARLRPGPRELAVRWVLLPAAITAVVFRAHQLSAFGDALGDWHLHGYRAWAATLEGHAAATLALLGLLGCAARLAAEGAGALWTALAPSQAWTARHAVEWLLRAVLYAGVPAAVALRFLA